MPLFIWKPSYDLGVAEIDLDHRHLVGLINELYEAMKVGHGYELINHLIDQLLEYTREHFANEEGFMRASGYPYLEPHVREHQEFRDKIEALDRGRRAGQLLPSSELLSFLCDWLRTHILDSDKDFGTFLKRGHLD
jgi:hemerythrin-like metal-binding protein